MTNSRYTENFAALQSAAVEDILATSDEDLVCEALDDGEDIESISNRVGSAMERALSPPLPPRQDHVLIESLERQLNELAELLLIRWVCKKHRRKRRTLSLNVKPGQLRKVERSIDCFLTWASPSETAAHTLGPYARWLIAARLLMRQQAAGTTLSAALGVDPQCVERAFSTCTKDDNSLATRSCFENSSRLDDAGEPVFARIIAWLDEHYSRTRGAKIERGDFLRVFVPLDRAGDHVGIWPIEYFEQWITQGVGIASRASVRKLLAEEAPCAATEADEATQAIVRDLDKDTGERQYKCILNVHSQSVAEQSTRIARHICRALLRKGQSAVYVSLAQQATRQSVVRCLYEAFGLNTQGLQELQRRPLDLATDLEPIRKALTVNRVVVVFDAWDNADAPFESLQEFLRNTNWGEILRVLAQPHEQTLLDSNERLQPKYTLLVLSARPAMKLAPWARFVTASTTDIPSHPPALVDSAYPVRSIETTRTHDEEARSEREEIEHDRHRLLEVLAMRLIAASVNGVRADTLERCINEWIRMCSPSWLRIGEESGRLDIGGWVHEFFNTQNPCLSKSPEDDLESLPVLQRSLELDRHPRFTAYHSTVGTACEVLNFKSSAARSAYISHWLQQDRAPADEQTPIIDKCSWGHINLVLAEECLRQVSSQLRHLPAEALDSPYAIRRAVQAVYHGLMSLEISSRDVLGSATRSTGTGAIGLYEPLLPADTDKRYRYLYGFLYRWLIEGADRRRLNRSMGRSDIRLDLLTLCVAPHHGVRMLTGEGDTSTVTLLTTMVDPQRIPEPLRESPELWSDVLLAIGSAGCDLGGEDGSRAADWALSLLEKSWPARKVGLRESLQDSGKPDLPVELSTLKLRLDWMALRQKQSVADLCWENLHELGLRQSMFDELRAYLVALLGRMRKNETGVTTQLQAKLEDMRSAVKQKAGSKILLETVADFLFRLGQIEALKACNEASRHDPQSGRHPAIDDLAYACAIFWLADRARSDAAALSYMGTDWSRADARFMRNYVRACLNLGRLLAEEKHLSHRQSELIARLFEHAQSREGVYTRQYYPLRRERNSMSMLEVNRVRTWIKSDLAYQTRVLAEARKKYANKNRHAAKWSEAQREYLRFLDSSQATLNEFCVKLLQEVERSLFSIGFPCGLIRRLYLERVETLTMMMELALAYSRADKQPSEDIVTKIDAYLVFADPALKISQEICARDPYWKATTLQQLLNVEQAKQQWSTLSRSLSREPTPRGTTVLQSYA